MPDQRDILEILRSNYSINIDNLEFSRDGGSLSYIVSADQRKYFLRVIRPELMDTALQSIDIHLYLSDNGFPVPAIIRTQDNTSYVHAGEKESTYLYVLYEFIEGQEPKSGDAENVGRLVGQFHSVMQGYKGKLTVRDKPFFIGRYIEILKKKNYPKTDIITELGNALWEKVKDLPRGYCHCDLYRGNVHKAKDGQLYILDFDTSSNAFPIYDTVLFCNETDYFKFNNDGLMKTRETFGRFLAGYLSCNALSRAEIMAFGDLMAIYHYQVQATVIEIYGLDCVDEAFIDNQLDWIQQWLKQCKGVSWG